jgi:pyruvate/2-oxoglutarate dehydrogenase complex dihydrolipoamide dehydrogenase (E3) component
MIDTDVLVIGGSASGLVAAMTARSHYPDAKVTVVRKEKDVLVPCGIPYIFGSLEGSHQNLIPEEGLDNSGAKKIIDEVLTVDCKNKSCTTKLGETINFDKIVFATGSNPNRPSWLKGAQLDNVFIVPKNRDYLDQVAAKLKGLNQIIVIGGGFIGVELSDELNKSGKDVTLVEMLPHVLGAVFDETAAKQAEDTLIGRGVKVKVGSGIKEISGTDRATGVVLESGEKLVADAVFLTMGYKPNTELAKRAGLVLNEYNQIMVDEFMRTAANPDVFAVGDCAQKRDFITRKKSRTMLASTACAEGRTAGLNLFDLSVISHFKGTIAVFSTSIGDLALGVAGMTYKHACEEKMKAFRTSFETPDHHPAKLEGMHMQSVELVVAEGSGMVLGGTAIGGKSVGEMVNTIGLAIQNNMTVFDLMTIQIGTHPLLTSSPTSYPLVKAAELAVKKIRQR